MLTPNGYLVPIHLDHKRENLYRAISDCEINRNTINQIAFLILEHHHFRYLGKRFPVHQHQVLPVDMSDSPQSRYINHHRRIHLRFRRHVEIHQPVKRPQHRHDRIQ